jgi:hypothetical protein
MLICGDWSELSCEASRCDACALCHVGVHVDFCHTTVRIRVALRYFAHPQARRRPSLCSIVQPVMRAMLFSNHYRVISLVHVVCTLSKLTAFSYIQLQCVLVDVRTHARTHARAPHARM